MAYADKPKPAEGGAPDALLLVGEGEPGGEHEAKLDAYRRMKNAASDEEGAAALADFIRICAPKYSS